MLAGSLPRWGEIYGDSFRLGVLDIVGSDENVIVLTSEEAVYRGDPIAWRGAHVTLSKMGAASAF